jgi:tRNA 2-selenouridine synthase
MDRWWRPLVYCWRGGQRSGSLAHVLLQVGWAVAKLEGGWRAYRTFVREDTTRHCATHRFHVISGLTGSGKTRFLHFLQTHGHQVLDLEALACHRGSLLGQEPGHPQPAQKLFESHLWEKLSSFDPNRPIYVESESRRIGRLFCPDPLWEALRHPDTPVTALDVPRPARAAFLIQDYAHFIQSPDSLATLLPTLKARHGSEQIETWQQQIATGQMGDFVTSILQHHYDVRYGECDNFTPTDRIPLSAVTEGEFHKAETHLRQAHSA